jgi:hypothetical protein
LLNQRSHLVSILAQSASRSVSIRNQHFRFGHTQHHEIKGLNAKRQTQARKVKQWPAALATATVTATAMAMVTGNSAGDGDGDGNDSNGNSNSKGNGKVKRQAKAEAKVRQNHRQVGRKGTGYQAKGEQA